MQNKCDVCEAAKVKRWDAEQYWIANILKGISHTWRGSSGYLTWRLMKEKICPPLMLHILHSSCFTVSTFHSLLLMSVLSCFLFLLFLQKHIHHHWQIPNNMEYICSSKVNRANAQNCTWTCNHSIFKFLAWPLK